MDLITSKVSQIYDLHISVQTALHYCLAGLTFLTLFNFFSILQIKIYPTINRVTYLVFFDKTRDGSAIIDNHLISLIITGMGIILLNATLRRRLHSSIFTIIIISVMAISFLTNSHTADYLSLAILPIFLMLMFLNNSFGKNILKIKIELRQFLVASIYTIIIFETLALLRWWAYPFFPNRMYSEWSWIVADIESRFFYTGALLAPFLMILLAYSFLVKQNISSFANLVQIISNKIPFLMLRNTDSNTDHELDIKIDNRVALLVALSASIILAGFPYLPTINPDGKTVSVDAPYYVRSVNDMIESDNVFDFVNDAFYAKAFRYVQVNDALPGDRPLSLFFIYFLHEASGLPVLTIVKFLPTLLSPLLVLVSYYFVRYTTENTKLASLSAIMVLFSYQFVVGIYAGFFANWLAIILNFIAFTFLIANWNKSSKSNYFTLLIVTVAVMFSHLFTWVYLMATIIIYLGISSWIYRKDQKSLFKIVLIGSIVVINIGIDLTKPTFGLYSGLDISQKFVSADVGVREFLLRWLSLPYTFSTHVGGHYGNAVLIILALIWAIKANYHNHFNRLLLSSIFVAAPFVFGDHTVQARLIYDVPIYIAAALGLSYTATSGGRFLNISPLVIIFVIFFHLGTYTLRALSNLVLVWPGT